MEMIRFTNTYYLISNENIVFNNEYGVARPLHYYKWILRF